MIKDDPFTGPAPVSSGSLQGFAPPTFATESGCKTLVKFPWFGLSTLSQLDPPLDGENKSPIWSSQRRLLSPSQLPDPTR